MQNYEAYLKHLISIKKTALKNLYKVTLFSNFQISIKKLLRLISGKGQAL